MEYFTAWRCFCTTFSWTTQLFESRQERNLEFTNVSLSLLVMIIADSINIVESGERERDRERESERVSRFQRGRPSSQLHY